MGLYHTFIVYQNINSIVQIGTYAYIYLSTPNYIHQCYPICSRFVSPTRQGSLLNNSRLMLYPHWSCSKTVDPTCSRGMLQMKKALLSGLKENWKMPELTDKPEISLDKLYFAMNLTKDAQSFSQPGESIVQNIILTQNPWGQFHKHRPLKCQFKAFKCTKMSFNI